MRSVWTIPVCLVLCLLAPRTASSTESKVAERFAYAEHGEALDAETGAPVVCGATCGTRVGTVVGYRGMRRMGLGDAYDARYRVHSATPAWQVDYGRDGFGRHNATTTDRGYGVQLGRTNGVVTDLDFGIGSTFTVARTIAGGAVVGATVALPDAALDTADAFDDVGRPTFRSTVRFGDGDADVTLARSRHAYDGMGRVVERWSGSRNSDGDIRGIGRAFEYAGNAGWLARVEATVGAIEGADAAQPWGSPGDVTTLTRTANGSLLREVSAGVAIYEATRPDASAPSGVEPLSGGTIALDWDPAGRLKYDGWFTHHWSAGGEWLGATTEATSNLPSRTVVRDGLGRAVRTRIEVGSTQVDIDHVFAGANVIEDRFWEDGHECLRRTNHYDVGVDASVGHSLERFGPCTASLNLAGIDPSELLVGELRTFAHVRDLAGHVVAVADEAGEVVERFAYAEHGEALDAETGAPVVCGATCGTRVGTVVGYRGMRRLGLGDAYDARYRIYDAQLRLFWSKDPLGWVDGYDRWAYVGGDPVNLWDPWGLAAAATRANSAYVVVDPDLSEAQLRQRAVLAVLSDLPRPWDRVHDLIWTDESEARYQQSIALDARVEPTNALVGDMLNHVVEGTPAASGMLWVFMGSGANPTRARPATVAPMSAAPSGGPATGGAARAGAAGAARGLVSTADDLTAAAARARAAVGPGRGPVYGTRAHAAFRAEVEALGRGNLSTEVSYLNGRVVPYGTRGSVRLDVVEGPLNAPTAIYDFKMGSAALSPARINQIRGHFPGGGSNVPVLEIR